MTAMRIIDLQRRLREIGRIRTGDTTVTQNGKTRPRKLERFRLTSRDRRVIDAAAATWGGDVTEWDAPDGRQWQVYIGADEIAVVVPPGDMSFSQSYEQWTAGGCKVRCDGQWDHIADQACHCDPTERACAIHTRLSVMVPDLPGIGVWRLETHSYYAAVELGGLVDLCAAQAAAGTMIPARLRLEQRSVKRVDNGKVVTRRFVVPVLDLDVHPLALGAGPGAAAALGTAAVAAPTAGPAITPVPEPDRVLRPSVAAQIGAVNEDQPRTSRQAEVPRTGLKPRTAEQAAATDHGSGGPADREAADTKTTAPPSADRADVNSPPDTRNAAGQHPPDGLTVKQVAQKAGVVFKADYDAAPKGDKTRIVNRLRHALVWAQTHGEHTSTTDITPEQLLQVWQRLEDITEGRLKYDLEPNAGVTWIMATGKRVTVTWEDIEGNAEPTPSGDAA